MGGLASFTSIPPFFIPAGFFPCWCFVLSPSDSEGSQGWANLYPPSLFFLAVPG